MSPMELSSYVKDVPDFPKAGIVYKDITPLLAQPNAFASAVDFLARTVELSGASEIVAIESRGFIFGAAVSRQLSVPLQLVRKPGKLPRPSFHVRYDLEYGSDQVEIHKDVIQPSRKYAIIDDVLATGGTAAATAELINSNGGVVECCAFVIELSELGGRQKLSGCVIESLIKYN